MATVYLSIYPPSWRRPNFRRKRRRLRSNPCRGSGFRLPLKSVLVSSLPGSDQEALGSANEIITWILCAKVKVQTAFKYFIKGWQTDGPDVTACHLHLVPYKPQHTSHTRLPHCSFTNQIKTILIKVII